MDLHHLLLMRVSFAEREMPWHSAVRIDYDADENVTRVMEWFEAMCESCWATMPSLAATAIH